MRERDLAVIGLRLVCWLAGSLGLALLGACAATRTPVPPAGPGVRQIRVADGSAMILVPAGEFLMGSTEADLKAGADEKPAHVVYVDAFWIDETEVTNDQYVRFLNSRHDHSGMCAAHTCLETRREDRDSPILHEMGRYVVEGGFERHPVIEVTWYGAQAYCQWAGGRLPTEAEWEKAARGTDGRRFPWGDDEPDCRRAQFADCGAGTTPVGQQRGGSSFYGALDMAGNVWEWVADWYDAAYYGSSPARNPLGPDAGERKAFRGGSWGYPAMFLRSADRARNRPTYAGPNLGFRCAA